MTTVRELGRRRQVQWRRFLAWVDLHTGGNWVFRGVGDRAFPLIPGIGRLATAEPGRRPRKLARQLEDDLLYAFERRLPEFLGEAGLTRLDKIAIAQHHGLPTRLLDWTTNPLAAAYFATQARPGAHEVLINGHKVSAIPDPHAVACRIVAYRVRRTELVEPTDDPYELTGVRILLPRALSQRITTQSGLFSVHADPARAWTEPLENPDHTFDIDGEMRSYFQRRLFYLGMDAQRIRGGLDGLCERLAWQALSSVGLGAVR